MRSVTLEEFVDTAPAEILEDLEELFQWASTGVGETIGMEGSTEATITRDRELIELYDRVADRLRDRIASN